MGPTRFPMPGRDDDGVEGELARLAIRSFARDLLTWLEDRADQAGSTWSATHFAAGGSVITLDLPGVRGLERRVTIRLAVGEHDGVIRDPGA